LDDDDSSFYDPPDSRASSIRGSQVSGQPPSPVASSLRIRKVSALSDFAPINLKVRRCGFRQSTDPRSHHTTYPNATGGNEGGPTRITVRRIGYSFFFVGLFWYCIVLYLHDYGECAHESTVQFFIFLFIWAEFSLYVIIRQLVNTKEWLLACE
jgi:hypothetical protein